MHKHLSLPQRRSTRHLATIGTYSVVALLLTWPLATQFTTHVPGDGIDNPALAWNLWWIKARFVDQFRLDIFDVDWMFHPVHINLAFYTLTPLNGLLSIPLQAASNLIIANNVVLLSSFVLGAYGAFLLALYIQARPPLASQPIQADSNVRSIRSTMTAVAVIAGLIYGFASAKLFYAALGQYNIASSQWIPFAALYILRLGDSHSVRSAIRNGAIAGMFIVLQAWSELTYASFLLIFFALYTAWWMFGRLAGRRGPAGDRPATVSTRSFASGLAAAALVFVIGLSPFLAAMLPDLLRDGDFFASGGGFADVFSADLMGYLAPTRLHPLLGAHTSSLPFPNDKGQHIYIGYTLLLIMALGVVGYGLKARRPQQRNMIWFWLLAAVAFWLLTLGPQLRWAGNDLPIPGPFALVSRLPFFSGNRYPSRYSVMLLLCAAALSVYGLRFLGERVTFAGKYGTQPGKVKAVMAGVGALLLVEHVSVPLPMVDFRVPAIYQAIAGDPDDFTVLELPTGWRNGARVMGRSDLLIMMQQWYQTAHGKRRLGGNTSRNPPLKFQYFTEAPLLGDMIALMNADQEHIAAAVEPDFDRMVARARDIAPGVLDFLGVRYITLHVEESPDLLVKFVEEALPLDLVDTWTGADWSGTPSTIRLYEVRQFQESLDWEADLADPDSRLYLAEGWSTLDDDDAPFRYATRPRSVLLLDLPAGGGALQLQLAGIAESVDVRLNGHALEDVRSAPGQWLHVEIPPGSAGEPIDRLTIDWHGGPLSISEMGPPSAASERPIGEIGVMLPPGLSLSARSAGEEVGDFAHVIVNGVDYAPGERGYNLVAVSKQGNELDARVFDTHASHEASDDMAAWLGQWPAGTIIAGAVADDASYSLQPEAVRALASAGVATDLSDRFRWSHAFIGVTGAEPGSALEDAGLLAPASVFLGAPIDASQVTGGIGSIKFSPSD